MLNIEVEIKIDAVKKDYCFKKSEMASMRRKPDLSYDFEYIFDKVSVKSD